MLGHGITAYPKFVQEVWIIEFDYFNYSADLAVGILFIQSETLRSTPLHVSERSRCQAIRIAYEKFL